jgi:tetratricopeptide (TPR) repeat protein
MTEATPPTSIPRYSAAEEATHLTNSTNLKNSGNSLFAISNYDGALSAYEQAVAALPTYLDFEMAVLRSNMAACCVKLEEWKKAVEECDKGLEGLDAVEEERKKNEDERVVEIEDDSEDGNAEEGTVERSLATEEDVKRIRTSYC